MSGMEIDDDLIEGLGPEIAWRQAMTAYEADELAEAHALAERFGGAWGGALLGTYRQIEAEWYTRRTGEVRDLGDGITFEWPGDAYPRIADGERIVRQTLMVAEWFGWKRVGAMRVSWLSPSVDAPWLPMRAGYYSLKQPYHKICLPSTLEDDEMEEALRHEVAHAMVRERAGTVAPVWLHEAVAQVAEGRRLSGLVRRFADRERWLDPEELNAAFHVDRRDPGAMRELEDAYAQAALIGGWLARQGGEAKLGQLLDAFTDNTLLTDLKMRVTGQSPADEALKQVYGLGERELFTRMSV